MSETPRTYEKPRGAFSRGEGFTRPGGIRLRYFAIALAVFFVYAFWVTRDRYPMEQFIPADQRLHISIPNFLENRAQAAESPVWAALPDSAGTGWVPEYLKRDLGHPDWVLQNLIRQQSHVSANDLEGMSDALFVTRMSPVGCLLERWFGRFTRGELPDKAGGLRLHQLTESDLYYAVRGRVLIISRSRDALIHSLTLDGGESFEAQEIEMVHYGEDATKVNGRVVLDEADWAGEVVQLLRFALNVDDTEGRLEFQLGFQPAWEARLAKVLTQSRPVSLAAPVGGPLSVSANFGVPMKDLWSTIGESSEWPFFSEDQWERWATDEAETATGRTLTELLGGMGPGVRVSWTGMDLDATVPAPQVVALFAGDEANAAAVMEARPAPPVGPAYVEPYTQYDAETKRLVVPELAGTAVAPTAVWSDGALLIGSNVGVAEAYLAAPNAADAVPGPANFYLSLDPQACARAFVQTGSLLTQNGLLKGHTPESFQKASGDWMRKANLSELFTALVRVQDGVVEGELHLQCVAD